MVRLPQDVCFIWSSFTRLGRCPQSLKVRLGRDVLTVLPLSPEKARVGEGSN
jgi:hypothetical protein